MKNMRLTGLLITLVAFSSLACAQELKLTMIDIVSGNGDSMLIETPGGKKILIDAGMPESGEKRVVPFLKNKGITKLDSIVLTHQHEDHYGGMVAVIREFPVGEFIDSASSKVDDGQKFYSKVRKLLKEKNIPLKRPSVGDVYDWGGATAKVLNSWNPEVYDPDHSGGSENDGSIVLKITYKKTSFLTTGDIQGLAEEHLLKTCSPEDLKCDLLKVPHHGIPTSSTFPFVRAVEPKVCVVCPGALGPMVMERFRIVGAQLYRVDLDGNVEITSDGEKLHVQTQKTTTESKFSPRRISIGLRFNGDEGTYVKKRKNGDVERSITYKNGKADGDDFNYRGKDKISAKLHWSKGLLDGNAEYYYWQTGKVLASIGYKEGIRDGMAQYFSPEGNLWGESSVKNDKTEWTKIYNDSGKLIKHLIFEGNIVKTLTYDEEGKLISTEQRDCL